MQDPLFHIGEYLKEFILDIEDRIRLMTGNTCKLLFRECANDFIIYDSTITDSCEVDLAYATYRDPGIYYISSASGVGVP